MRKAWLAALGLLLVPALPARGDEWTHQYALKGRPELHVTTDDGSVQIEASDRREIGARVTTRGWRLGTDEVVITESQAGDRVDIEVRVPHDNWGMNFGHRDIKVTLQVPREADLDIRTGDGSVSVQPISGRLRIFTGRREHHRRRSPGRDPAAHGGRFDPGHGARRPARGRYR